MGWRNAMDMAEAVERGEAEAAIALDWHLTHNHYSPLPPALAETARAAIVAVREGEMDRQIPLPVGMLFRGRRAMTAAEAVQSLHLEAFVGQANTAGGRTEN